MASLAPFRDRGEAEETLILVDGLRERHLAGHGLPPIEIGDLEGILRRLRIEGNVLSPEDFLSLGSLLAASRMVKRALGEPGPGNPVGGLGSPLNPLPHLERSIEETFENDGSIKDRASPALRRIRRDREQKRERLRSRMEGLAAKLTQKDSATLVTLREGRYVLAVPQELRSRVDGLVLDRSGSGATFYVEPMDVVDANNGLRELEAEERAEIRRILVELTEKLRPERASLAEDWEHLGYLDTLRARVLLALRWGAEKPAFSDDGGVRLRGARHPLLLEGREVDRDREGARARVIPLDLELDESTRILLITGPNMGGKTVALKTLGLLSALAQTGCFVPAGPGTEFPWIRRWVVSLGDEQSLEQDLSTFAAHLGRWGEALAEAGPETLILLDELGSGTDPLEGAALAQSVLERLVEARAVGLVTTHLGSLKGFAASLEGIQNASMVFDGETREPTFHLRVGIPGESHALDMARRLGFPEERVARAEALLPREERDVKELLQSLERERSRMASAREDLDRTLEAAEKAREEHQEKLGRLLEERAELRARAARQAREILRQAEETLKQAEKTARKERKTRPPELERARLVREQARLGRLAAPRQRPQGREPDRIRAGDVLWAPALGRKVEVVREMDGSGNVWVLSNGVRVSLPAKSLRVSEKTESVSETETPRPAQMRPGAEDVSSDLDLRGLRVDECLEKLDRALDRALLSGLKEIRVIHGKGTGALKEAVESFCRTHSAVHGIRTAPDWQGGAGATLVELEG